MGKRDQKLIEREWCKSGKKSTNWFLINAAREEKKGKNKSFKILAEERFQLSNFAGFSAHLSLDSTQLQHRVRSENIWSKYNYKKHSYSKEVPQLNVSFPLDCSVDKRRKFISLASKHFKNLTKLDVKVQCENGKVYSYNEAKKKNQMSKIKKILSVESQHQSAKGKRDDIYHTNRLKRDRKIYKQVTENCKKGVGVKRASSLLAKHFSLTPKTVQNIYYKARKGDT